MKKATTKRERKYGKKNQDGVRVSKNTEERIVKVMVDYGMILKFKNMDEAQAHINKSNKEAKENGSPPTSFVIL